LENDDGSVDEELEGDAKGWDSTSRVLVHATTPVGTAARGVPPEGRLMGYISTGQAEASRWIRGGARPSLLSPEAVRLHDEAAARVRATAGEGEQHLDAEGREIQALLSAGWVRAPWRRIGDGSSDWIAPDKRRLSREEAVREVTAAQVATTSGPATGAGGAAGGGLSA
jgi:hypothetical protein